MPHMTHMPDHLTRQVKAHAAQWEMESALWMFQDNKDVECDVQLMQEYRTSLVDDCKYLDKIIVAERRSDMFGAECAKLKDAIAATKVPSPVHVKIMFSLLVVLCPAV